MAVSEELLKLLVCPDDHADVHLVRGGAGLQCERCRRVYPIREDIPVMLIEEASVEPELPRD
ncbi:MAG: Trm112 family protein [Terriglobales bacterium]